MENSKNLAEDNFLQHETEKRYLGDGVYASFDGYHVKLYTLDDNVMYLENNVIYLDLGVMQNAVDYIEHIKRVMNDTTDELDNDG